jgi:trans-aconitate methyltransferase
MSGTLIGNGSEVNVLYTTYEWEFKGRSGVSADLRAVQVTNLVPYNTDADAEEAFEVVPDGFVSNESDEEVSFAS